MKKRIIRIAAFVIAAVMLALIPISAKQIPSLFWNDEVWFRDAISPLVIKDGVYYIPADLCAMFDSVAVETPRENNVLIYNLETGGYVSALIDSGIAAVNGEIIETESFRSGGVCYLDAELVCSAVGLSADYLTEEDGTVSMRVADSDELVPLIDLAEFNRIDDDDNFRPNEEYKPSDTKTLYMICESDSGTQLSVCDILESQGLGFTCFLRNGTSSADIMFAASHGEFGLIADGSAADADELNERCMSTVRRGARVVISSAWNENELRADGYVTVSPDITVDGGTYAMGALKETIDFLADHDYCVIYIKPSWNGCEFARLVSELDSYTFRTANFEEPIRREQ